MRLYYLLLLLTTSVSGFAQSSMNVKITLSDKVITVPKDNFVSLSFEESNEDDILNNVHIVGYIQSKTEGTKSFYWSGKERKAYILNGEYSEVVATHISGSNGNIYISGWVEDNAGIRKMCLWRNGEMIIPIFNTQMGPDIMGQTFLLMVTMFILLITVEITHTVSIMNILSSRKKALTFIYIQVSEFIVTKETLIQRNIIQY